MEHDECFEALAGESPVLVGAQCEVEKEGDGVAERREGVHEPDDQSIRQLVLSYSSWVRTDAYVELLAPILRPCLAQTLWGIISPNITINPVLTTTATQPPIISWSRNTGRASFAMTLPKRSVTRTQCFPLLRRERTFWASDFCGSSPERESTRRVISSWPINLRYIIVSRDASDQLQKG